MKRKNKCRMFNLLGSSPDHVDFAGFSFILQPNVDPIAWKALQYYAIITPNIAQRQALLVWLHEHPNPAGPEVEQLEMELML